MTDLPHHQSSSVEEENNEDSWAAFDDIHASATGELADGDDEFFKADAAENEEDEWNDFEFASAAPQTSVVNVPLETVEQIDDGQNQPVATTSSDGIPGPPLTLQLLLHDLDQLLHSCWRSDEPASSDTDDNDDRTGTETSQCSDNHRLSVLSDILGENDDVKRRNEKHEPDDCDLVTPDMLALWTSLRLIEEAAALKCQWGEARVYEHHVAALRMDLKLAKIRNPKLPAFAWQLSGSTLTPQRTATLTVSGGSVSSTISTQSEHKQSTESIQSTAVVRRASCGPNDSGGGCSNGSTVPPVQFDWSSSGLSNPLCEGAVDSDSMDLDYFANSKARVSSSITETAHHGRSRQVDTWKSDLKMLGLMADDDASGRAGSAGDTGESRTAAVAKSNSTSISLLEKLMNSNHRTTAGVLAASSCESMLSEQTRRLLDSLPDLSFMLSPVLMFPIREDTGGSETGDDVQL